MKVTTGDANAVKVRRTHIPVVPAGTRIVYGAQCEGFNACIADMAQPPGMKPEVHWLANYVMLSRATSLDGLLILRLVTRAQLTVGAPQYLKDEIDRLLQLEKQSIQQLRARLSMLEAHLTKSTLKVFAELFECDDIGRHSYAKVGPSQPASFDITAPKSEPCEVTAATELPAKSPNATVAANDASQTRMKPQVRRRVSKKTPQTAAQVSEPLEGIPTANAEPKPEEPSPLTRIGVSSTMQTTGIAEPHVIEISKT